MVVFRNHLPGYYVGFTADVKEFPDESAMKQHVYGVCHADHQGEELFCLDDIIVEGEPMQYEKLGWDDCRNVCLKRYGDENYIEKLGTAQVIGFCATSYRTPQPISVAL